MNKSRHHLAEIVAERTMHVSNSKQLAEEIAAYLLHENLTSELESLMRDVIEYRANHGAVEAVAVSAYPLSEAIKADLKELIQREYPKQKSIKIDEALDPTLVGGIRLDLPGEQLDTTVRTKLNTFKRLTSQERN